MNAQLEKDLSEVLDKHGLILVRNPLYSVVEQASKGFGLYGTATIGVTIELCVKKGYLETIHQGSSGIYFEKLDS